MSRRFMIVALVVEAAVYVGLCYSNARQSSATYDEQSHLLAGFVKLKRGDHRFVPEHAHLPQVWAALPLLGMDITAPSESASPEEWNNSDTWLISQRWLHQSNRPMDLLVPARIMIAVLGVVLGALVVWTSWRFALRADRGVAAVLAGAIFALSPTMIAHGSLVTTDIAAALGIFGATAAAAVFIRRPGLLNGLLVGAAGGAALMLKFSLLLVLPGFAAWWLIAAMLARRSETPRSGRERARQILLSIAGALAAVIAGWAVIWASYGFRYSSVPDEQAEEFRRYIPGRERTADDWQWVLSGSGFKGRVAAFVRERRLLPESLIWGLAYTARESNLRVSYYLGRRVSGGSPTYFPTLFLLKTPIPLMILLALGATAFVRSLRAGGMIAPAAEMLAHGNIWSIGAVCLVGCYSLIAVTSSYNIGHRHLTPIYPFLFVAAALVAARLLKGARGDRIGLAVLGLWYLIGAVRTHPHELAFFNEAIVRPSYAGFVAADSNIDWGQDMLRLAKLQNERGWDEIKLSYFGSGDPAAYGVRARYLPGGALSPSIPAAAMAPGVYAISLSCLRLAVIDLGVLERLNVENSLEWNPNYAAAYRLLAGKIAAAGGDPTALRADELEAWNKLAFVRLMTALREREPDAVAGKSVYVYELDQEELNALVAP